MTERLSRAGFADNPNREPDTAAPTSRRHGTTVGKHAAVRRIDRRIAGPFATGRPVTPERGRTGRFGAPATRWESRYRWAVIVSDLVATLLAVLVVGGLVVPRHVRFWPVPLAFAVLTVLVVTVAVALHRGWHPSVLGAGAEEFRRLGRGLASAVVILALGGLAGGLRDMRWWVFVVVPAIAVFSVAQRFQLRKLLHRARRSGRCLLPVLVAGGTDSVLDLISRTRSAPHIGWRVEAACTAGPGVDIDGVPVVGGLDDLARHVKRGSYRIVAVTADAYWTPDRLRQLAWDLEGSDTEMVVAPVLMEVVSPRVHVTGVLGMPMLRVAAPVFTGTRRMVKEIADRPRRGVVAARVRAVAARDLARCGRRLTRWRLLPPAQGRAQRPGVHDRQVPHDGA